MDHQPFISPEHARLIRRLETIAEVGEPIRRQIAALPLRIKTVAENEDIVREGDHPRESCLVLDGVICRYKLVAGGKRQILSLNFAGDLPDFQSLHLDAMDHHVSALVPSRVAFIPHEALLAAIHAMPELGDLFDRHSLIEASQFREWIANVGRRSALQRVAHIFCEVYLRMRALGLSSGDAISLPLTQTEIGDATGLSTVHVNRVMQELRRRGLIASNGNLHTFSNWEGLREAGDFDPLYLHLRPEARP